MGYETLKAPFMSCSPTSLRGYLGDSVGDDHRGHKGGCSEFI